MSEEATPQISPSIHLDRPSEAAAPVANLASNTFSLPPEPPSASLWHNIFVGQSGLRAGWGVLLYIALVFTLAAGIGALVRTFHHPAHHGQKSGQVVEQSPESMLIGEGISVVVVSLAAFFMGRIERRPITAYGFGGTRKLPNFLAGFAWGAIFLSILVGALWKSGLLVFDGRLLYGLSAVRYGLIWTLGFLLVGIFEESLLRGYIQYTLSRGIASLYRMLPTTHSEALGFWTAAFLLSALFGLIHGRNPGESPVGLLSAALIGLVFCLTLWRTGSLWWALGFHASWDWAQSFLFGVADSGTMVQCHLFASHPVGELLLSGGATGPEGSVFILPLLLAITGIVFLTLPARKTPGSVSTSANAD